jgi:hypothetical protein
VRGQCALIVTVIRATWTTEVENGKLLLGEKRETGVGEKRETGVGERI